MESCWRETFSISYHIQHILVMQVSSGQPIYTISQIYIPDQMTNLYDWQTLDTTLYIQYCLQIMDQLNEVSEHIYQILGTYFACSKSFHRIINICLALCYTYHQNAACSHITLSQLHSINNQIQTHQPCIVSVSK